MDQESNNDKIQEIRQFLDYSIDFIKQKPIEVLVLAIILVLFYYYWQVMAVVVTIFVIGLLSIKLAFPEPTIEQLLAKQRRIQDEISIAESMMRQHKIEEKAYQEIVNKNQRQIVELEAQIKKKESEQQIEKEMNFVPTNPKNRHLLKQLLERKQTIQEELRIAETKFYKRKINNATYGEILKQKQKDLVALEAEIKSIISEDSVEQIKKELAEKLSELENKE